MEPEIHYRGRYNPPLVPILSQINPVLTLPSYSFTVHFNIIPFYVNVFQVAFLLQVPHLNSVRFLLSPCVPHVPSFSMWSP